MQQGDTSNYYHPSYQYPNSNPNVIDPHATPWPPSSASAPPLSTADYPNFPPPYPQNPTSQSPYPYYDPNPPSYYPHDPNHYPNSNPNPNPTPFAPYDDWGGYSNNSDGYGGGDNGVYKYEGGKVEPYGARGTAGYSRNPVMFDDYGRPIGVSNVKENRPDNGGSMGSKMVKAVPKADMEDDVKGGGVQKFRVTLLSEGYGHSDLDVLCQIGLDGIRMLDPASNRTLRIYPLETVTRWEVLDSYIFAFWAKMPVDVEPKRIRLKSNSYTTNTILDIVTAASVQLKEIGERKDPSLSKASELSAERKKGLSDWMNLIKPPNEEKDHWVPDEAVNKCTSCGTNFNAFIRRHHCRNCGDIFCDKCTQGRTPLTMEEEAPVVRVCDRCMAEVTQRLENAKEAANQSGAMLRHEDLAKKLKEEMSRNSKTSAGSKSEGSQKRMREVACPTCTVHLQVQVPVSGSETIECSVCQLPFLVSAD